MENAFYQEIQETWKMKLRRRLFPSYRRPFSELLLSEGYKDLIIVKANTHFSWRDRLRVLISGNIVSDVLVYTEDLPGKTKSVAQVYVLPPQ